MSGATQVIDRVGHEIVAGGAQIISQDIRDIFEEELQFGGDPEIVGASLIEAEPWTPYTVALKEYLGAPMPSKPRVRFGTLMASIAEEVGDLVATVNLTDPDDTKVEYQQRTRPFWGVSDRALKGIEELAASKESELTAALDGIELETVRVTVRA